MVSIEQRLQMKREPLDKWATREQLCLVSSVIRSGDQNWMSASRALKPFAEPNRPTDWFNQKNCAAQFGALLANVETPKRKKRLSGVETCEPPTESILKRLKHERLLELKKVLAEEKAEYLELQQNMLLLNSGTFTEEQLDKWCEEIDEEEFRKEQESNLHGLWLKEREAKKQEIERAWRPIKPSTAHVVIGQKRKNVESIDSMLEHSSEDSFSSSTTVTQDSPKPALSPLLTSLLKSPSQVQNVVTSSILHSAITNQRPIITNPEVPLLAPTTISTSTNPMIASLLNSSTNVAVSPGLQQLVSTAIGQEQEEDISLEEQEAQDVLGTPDILDDETLRNLKIEDIANSIISSDDPLPEMKHDVDVIISDLMVDPEQHLQLDGNGDINIGLELDDLDDAEESELIKEPAKEPLREPEKPMTVDPFEFQEDPEIEPKISPLNSMKQLDSIKHFSPSTLSLVSENSKIDSPVTTTTEDSGSLPSFSEEKEVEKIIEDVVEQTIESETNEALDDIVEVIEEEKEIAEESSKTLLEAEVVIEEKKKEEEVVEEVEKEIVETVEKEAETEVEKEVEREVTKEVQVEDSKEGIEEVACVTPVKEVAEIKEEPDEEKKDISLNLDEENTSINTIVPDFNEELYDDITMEVKIDKTGRVKRDYSRTKKKEEKDFDMLLAIQKAHMEDELLDETLSDKDFQELDRKDVKYRIKSENDRSSSPWTEEDDRMSVKSRRRISTPATPIDSVPNSPASSSTFYDDDKDYRHWKKSIMLVYSQLAAHKNSSLFLKPITDDQAPNYHGLVFRPMDFQTIRKNVEGGAIKTTYEFKRDVMLMLNNAIMYNKTNSSVFNMTTEIQLEAIEAFQILSQAQNHNMPLRRETRTSEPGVKRKRGSEEVTSANKKQKH